MPRVEHGDSEDCQHQHTDYFVSHFLDSMRAGHSKNPGSAWSKLCGCISGELGFPNELVFIRISLNSVDRTNAAYHAS